MKDETQCSPSSSTSSGSNDDNKKPLGRPTIKSNGRGGGRNGRTRAQVLKSDGITYLTYYKQSSYYLATNMCRYDTVSRYRRLLHSQHTTVCRYYCSVCDTIYIDYASYDCHVAEQHEHCDDVEQVQPIVLRIDMSVGENERDTAFRYDKHTG
jgi:hypothetical protein